MNRRLLAALFALPAVAAAETADFLRLQPSARSAAMGDALAAAADGADALTGNPAGLALQPARQASFSHAELFDGTKLDHLGYLQAAGDGAAIGGSLRRLSHPKIEGRDINRAPNGSFDAADTAAGAAYALAPRPGLRLGAGLKYVETRVADASGRSAAVDLGAQYAPWESGLSFGASALNLGPGLKPGSETEALPSTLSVGASARSLGALFALEFNHRPNAGRTALAVGSEVRLAQPFAVRLGYVTKPLQGGEGSAGGVSGLSTGFGVSVSQVTLDYAFSPYGDLQDLHRVSLAVRF